MAEKKCSKCGEIKPLDCYYVRRESGNLRNECKECIAKKAATWKAENRERAAANNRASYHRDIDRTHAVSKAWKSNNKDKVADYQRRSKSKPEVAAKKAAYDRNWKQANIDKTREWTNRWRHKNPEKIAFLIAKRRAAQKQATPSWFEQELVMRLYKEAEKMGSEVDHIVPLVSEVVCGLHCWANLQILPRQENIRKGNRRWPDMP